MGGWEETDDPLKEHLRGNKSCAWAVLRDLLVRSKNGEEFGDNVEDPRSEKMNGLREATFGKWWPHDDKKGWNPKSKKVRSLNWGSSNGRWLKQGSIILLQMIVRIWSIVLIV